MTIATSPLPTAAGAFLELAVTADVEGVLRTGRVHMIVRDIGLTTRLFLVVRARSLEALPPPELR